MIAATLDQGMTVAAGFYALALLMAFSWAILLGFVNFVRRFLG